MLHKTLRRQEHSFAVIDVLLLPTLCLAQAVAVDTFTLSFSVSATLYFDFTFQRQISSLYSTTTLITPGNLCNPIIHLK